MLQSRFLFFGVAVVVTLKPRTAPLSEHPSAQLARMSAVTWARCAAGAASVRGGRGLSARWAWPPRRAARVPLGAARDVSKHLVTERRWRRRLARGFLCQVTSRDGLSSLAFSRGHTQTDPPARAQTSSRPCGDGRQYENGQRRRG